MYWFKKLFKGEVPKPPSKKVQVDIKKGQVWGLKDESPWPLDDYTCKILDYKENWVKYSLGGPFNNERCEESTFRAIYSLKEKES
jgi:hypothetical protein